MTTIKVSGMSCEHCGRAVKKALASLPDREEVTVDHQEGKVCFREKNGWTRP